MDTRRSFSGTRTGGFSPLGRHSLPKEGGKHTKSSIIKKEPDTWVTRNTIRGVPGRCIVLDGKDASSLKEPKKYPHMLQPHHVAEMEEQYGEDSRMIWTYIRGRIAPGGIIKVVMSDIDLEDSAHARPIVWESDYEVWAGGDFAPEGGDGNVVHELRLGKERGGTFIIQLATTHYIKIQQKTADKSGQISKQLLPILRRWKVPLSKFSMDISGNQGPLADRFELDAKQTGIIRVSSEGAASKRMLPGSIPAQDRYKNRATEIAFNLEMLLRNRQFLGVSDDIAHQITTREYSGESTFKMQISPKDGAGGWKSQNDGRSPDEFDAACVGVTGMLERGAITFDRNQVVMQAASGDWEDARQRLDTRGKSQRIINLVRGTPTVSSPHQAVIQWKEIMNEQVNYYRRR